VLNVKKYFKFVKKKKKIYFINKLITYPLRIKSLFQIQLFVTVQIHSISSFRKKISGYNNTNSKINQQQPNETNKTTHTNKKEKEESNPKVLYPGQHQAFR